MRKFLRFRVAAIATLTLPVIMVGTLFINPASADVTAVLSPTTDAVDGATSWSSATNAYANGGGAATNTPNDDRHRFGGFGISIPSGSTIDGITVSADAWDNASGGCSVDVDLSWNSGTSWTGEQTNSLGGSETTETYGGTTDTWGRSWTPSEFSNFMVRVQAVDGSTSCNGPSNFGTDDIISLDWLRVQVTYTPPTLIPFTETFGTSNVGTVTDWTQSGTADITGVDNTPVTEDTTRDGTSTNKFARIANNGSVCQTFDASDDSDLYLSYYWKGDTDTESDDEAIVEYKLGDCVSGSWTQVNSHEISTNTTSWSSQVVFDLPSSVDGQTFSVRFRTDSNSPQSNEAFRVDQVVIEPYGHIVVDKVTNPSGDAQSFSFDAVGGSYADFALTDAATQNDQALAPGNYSVSETVPAGWVQSSATCVSSITDTETPGAIELDAGETVTCTFTNTKLGSISGAKLIDTNGDGSLGGGETTGVGGVTITLNPGNVTTVTAPDGSYSFTGLLPDTYTITETAPAGSVQTTPNPAPIVLAAGQNVTDVNFGNFEMVVISGSKYEDSNGDGTQQGNEASIPNWPMGLGKVGVRPFPANPPGPGNEIPIEMVQMQLTGPGGQFQFTPVGPGEFLVIEGKDPAWSPTQPALDSFFDVFYQVTNPGFPGSAPLQPFAVESFFDVFVDISGQPVTQGLRSLGIPDNTTFPRVGVTPAPLKFGNLQIVDLVVLKTNDLGVSNALVGIPFTWTLTVSNIEAGSLEFMDGEIILEDNLPSGATYSTPAVVVGNGSTGTVLCSIVSNVLECEADGVVTIPSSGTVTVNISVTPTAAGSLVNPTGGVCAVDPDNVVIETIGGNNGCADTVTVDKQDQTIDFDPLADKTYGDPDFDVSATASSGLPVSFGASGDCSMVDDDTVSITGAGSCTITASQSGDGTYNAAPNVDQSFTVNKANAVVVVAPYDVTYDGLPHTATVTSITGVNGEVGATVGVVDVSNTTHTNAGNYAADYWTFTGTANYNDIGATTIIDNIDQASSTTVVTCPVSETYTGSAIEPCTVSVTGVGGLNLTPNPVYADNTDVGTASASYTYAGDANHSGSSDSETFEITQASSTTVVTCPAGPFTYTGSAQTPCSVSVTGVGGLSLTPAADYSNNTNAGTATASYTYAGDANHTGSSDSEDFTIGKADAVCDIDGYTGVYDALPHSASGTCDGDGVIDYGAPYTNVPGGTAHWTYTGASNYEDTEGDVSIVITAKTASVTPDAKSKVYGEADPALTGTLSGFIPADSVTATYSRTAGEDVSGSPYTISADLDPDAVLGNYDITYNTANFTITKASSTIVISNSLALAITDSVVGEPVTVEWEVTLIPTGGTATGTVTVKNGGTPICSAPVGDGECTITTFTFPQGTSLIAVYAGDSNVIGSISTPVIPHTVVKADTTTVISNAAALATPTTVGETYTVEWDVTVNVPGAGTPTGTVTVTGGSGCSAPVAVGQCDVTSTTAGAKTLVATYSGDTNFNGSASTGTPHGVDQAVLTVTADDKEITYGEADPAFTFGYSGFVMGDDASDLTTEPTCSVVGPHEAATTYPIVCSGGVDENYSFFYVDGTLTVNKASLTVTATGINKAYDGNNSATVTLADNRQLGDDITLAYGSASFDTADVGVGKPVHVVGIDVTGPDAGNYTWNTEADTTADITQATATIELSDLSHVYDGTAKSATVTTVPDGISYSVTYGGGATLPVDAGNYAVVATITDPNYSGSDADTLVISKADQTIIFGALVDKIIGDPDFDVSATASSGLPVTFAASGDCSMADADTVHLLAAGSCTITASQAGNGNYNAALDVGQTFTIADVPAPVISAETAGNPTNTTMLITWTTNNPATSRVVYDTVSHDPLAVFSGNYGYAFTTVETDTSPKVTSHSVLVTGLTPGTTYYFRPVSQGSPESVGDEVTSTTTQTPPTGNGKIFGFKFLDRNGDGRLWQDLWRRLAGWTIYIDSNDNGSWDTGEPKKVTNWRGEYSFTNLPAGTYIVREELKAGWVQTYPAAGKHTVTLGPNQTVQLKSFGNFKLGSISGKKFEDKNGNKRKDWNEGGLAGWTIELRKADNTLVATTVTNAQGNYTFTGLQAGTYKVREVQQAGWTQKTTNPANIVITSGTNATGKDFGNKKNN